MAWFAWSIAAVVVILWGWSLRYTLNRGYKWGQADEVADRGRYLQARFEEGKRFEHHRLRTTLDLLDMREDRRKALTHKLGLCGCSRDCCCAYKD